MTSNSLRNKVCITCGDANGRQVICNGCEQVFCWTHMTDHQHDIEGQMQSIKENHRRWRENWKDEQDYSQLLERIDRWEKESIEKIHRTADSTRAELRQLIEQSTQQLQTSAGQISEQIEQGIEKKNFTEPDIQRWTQQLNEMRSETEALFHIDIQEHERIPLIRVGQKTKRLTNQYEPANKRLRSDSASNEASYHEFSGEESTTLDNDRFDQVFGNARLAQNNVVVVASDINTRSMICGSNVYSNGTHTLCFHIDEVYTSSWSCLFGIMTWDQTMNEKVSEMGSVYGVWSSGYHVKHGQRTGLCGARKWYSGHRVRLAIDCDRKKFQLANDRISWNEQFDIDIRLCPLPWKFLIIIRGCQLRIVHPSQTE